MNALLASEYSHGFLEGVRCFIDQQGFADSKALDVGWLTTRFNRATALRTNFLEHDIWMALCALTECGIITYDYDELDEGVIRITQLSHDELTKQTIQTFREKHHAA